MKHLRHFRGTWLAILACCGDSHGGHFGSSHFSQTGCDAFPVRRRVMPRRGWHNEEWSRQWLQLLMGPRPPSVQWPHSRPLQAPKGSGKGRGRSQPPGVPVPKPAVSTTRTNPAESDSEVAAKLAKLEAAYSSLDQASPEAKYLKSVIDKTRVRAGKRSSRKAVGRVSVHGEGGQAFGDGQASSGRRSQSRIVCKKSTTSGPQDWRS